MFSKNDISLAKRLVEAGLERAAKSFGSFTNEPIRITPTRFSLDDELEVIVKMLLRKENVYFINSEIKGEVKGVSFLVFSERDAIEFFQMCFPGKDISMPENQEMKDAILMELANILTAAVIAEFADRLNINIYGYVPILKKLNQNCTAGELQKELEPFKATLCFDTVFSFDHDKYKPVFLWALEETFITQIKSIQSSEKSQDVAV